MSRTYASMARPLLLGASLLLTAGVLAAPAGEHRPRRARRPVVAQPVPTVRRIDPVYGDRLGTFVPTPALGVMGNYPSGVGYSPLGTFNQSMSLIGPYSGFRTTTAPVLTYTRGYDGVVRPTESVSNSYPNYPGLAPFAYPTRANNYYAPRVRDQPGWESATDWIDGY